MADDDEYVEGDSSSEAADAPGEIPADVERPERVEGMIDSVSVHDAPEQKLKRSAGRATAARKAFAEAILANKTKAPEVRAVEPEPDPEDEALAAAEPEKPAAPARVEAKPVETPPAPSLDPEVRRLKEQLAAERLAVEKERVELEKRKAEPVETPPDALDFERYIDSQPGAYRTWLETMRGEKMSDEEFKSELKDFITAASMDVLGVPLPENVKAQFDAAQAKKIVKTHRTIQEKRAAAAAAKAEKERIAAAEKAEAERVEREWENGAAAVTQLFAPQPNAEGKPEASAAAKAYPWLAVEDAPGKIVVEVIRAAYSKDGTELSWQEASKQANDYLKAEWERGHEKRKPLLVSSQAAAAPAQVAAKPKPAVTAPVAAPSPRPAKPQKWSREAHMEQTKRAFMDAARAAKSE